ncbi:MAG: FGGY-family carbohydrate kinase [Desulfobacterales bacterium]|jgi:xylulokinase
MQTEPPKTHLNSTKYVLAIDLGSGSYKAAVVADTGEVIASAEENITTHFLPDGGAEQDPGEWWNGAKKAAKSVIARSGVSAQDIVAVGCDSQWSVVVPVDEDAAPLMNAVHWLDTRGGKYNRSVVSGFPRVQGYNCLKLMKWIKLTGMVPTHSGVDSLGHVLFIKNERPDIYARTHKFLEPMDYITSRLTGRITATQKTMSIFMIMDNRQWGSLEYDDKLLNLAGVDREKFPDLIPNDGVVGPLDPSVADELGLLPSTPVIAGVGDSNVSAIGSGAVRDFEAIIYIGTSYYMNCHVPFKKTDINHMIGSLPSAFPSKYMLFAEQGTGGKCVEHFLKNLVYPDDDYNTGPKPDDAYERFNNIASRSPAGSGGVIYLPWLNGSIAPSENPHARGGFMNLSLNTTRSHMTRAIMEGLAYNNRWAKGAAEKFIGRSIECFRFSGGGALSDIWAQIHADVMGVPIHQIDDPINTTVRGTALLALVSLGYRSIDDIPELIGVKQVFEPVGTNQPIYDLMYTQYRQLFKKNKMVFAALNQQG